MSLPATMQRLLRRLLSILGLSAICLGATSGSCSFFGIRGDAEITVDLAAMPAHRDIAQIVVGVRGLEFQKSDGGVEELLFRNVELIDLISLEDGERLRMFTDEELPEGDYVGVRLAFDENNPEDNFVLMDDGRDFDLTISQGDYAPIDFSVDDDRDDTAITLTLDARLSLSFDEDSDQFTLIPRLRSVTSDDAGQISGSVTASCSAGGSMIDGAVYLFQGDVEPDDADGNGVEPYATAPVVSALLGTQFSYALRFLPEGDYTIALTCRGDDEDPATDDNLRFQNAASIKLRRRQQLTHSIG